MYLQAHEDEECRKALLELESGVDSCKPRKLKGYNASEISSAGCCAFGVVDMQAPGA